MTITLDIVKREVKSNLGHGHPTRSLKYYSKSILLEKPEKLQFSFYFTFDNVAASYVDFVDETTVLVHDCMHVEK